MRARHLHISVKGSFTSYVDAPCVALSDRRLLSLGGKNVFNLCLKRKPRPDMTSDVMIVTKARIASFDHEELTGEVGGI
jgi:hypothetical protein